jgi:hypothetical protein
VAKTAFFSDVINRFACVALLSTDARVIGRDKAWNHQQEDEPGNKSGSRRNRLA